MCQWAGQARLWRGVCWNERQARKARNLRFYIETAYLSPAPQLLYNLGLLSLRSGQSVEAADLLLRYADLMGAKASRRTQSAVSEAESDPSRQRTFHFDLLPATVHLFCRRSLGRTSAAQDPAAAVVCAAPSAHRAWLSANRNQNKRTTTAREGSDEIPTLTLWLPQAWVLAPRVWRRAAETTDGGAQRSGFRLCRRAIATFLLQQVPDRTGCLTQTGCQLWIGEQLDVEQILVVRSLDFLGDGRRPNTARGCRWKS